MLHNKNFWAQFNIKNQFENKQSLDYYGNKGCVLDIIRSKYDMAHSNIKRIKYMKVQISDKAYVDRNKYIICEDCDGFSKHILNGIEYIINGARTELVINKEFVDKARCDTWR
jgi:hypothetical protein